MNIGDIVRVDSPVSNFTGLQGEVIDKKEGMTMGFTYLVKLKWSGREVNAWFLRCEIQPIKESYHAKKDQTRQAERQSGVTGDNGGKPPMRF